MESKRTQSAYMQTCDQVYAHHSSVPAAKAEERAATVLAGWPEHGPSVLGTDTPSVS